MTARWRFVTWNVHSCKGAGGRVDPARVADVLAGLQADAIALQEVDGRIRSAGGVHQLEELARRLGLEPVAGPSFRDERGDYGNALLTRHEVTGVRRLALAFERREPRGALDVDLVAGGASVRLLVTHLGLRRRERAVQLRRIAEQVERHDAGRPTVLLGDFNELRRATFSRAGLGPSAFPAHAAPRSFPARVPLLRLDRVLARPRPARFDARAVVSPEARAASDHLPVAVDVAWEA